MMVMIMSDSRWIRSEVKRLEVENRKEFLKFMAKGRALVEYAVEGELEGFKKIFLDEKEEM